MIVNRCRFPARYPAIPRRRLVPSPNPVHFENSRQDREYACHDKNRDHDFQRVGAQHCLHQVNNNTDPNGEIPVPSDRHQKGQNANKRRQRKSEFISYVWFAARRRSEVPMSAHSPL